LLLADAHLCDAKRQRLQQEDQSELGLRTPSTWLATGITRLAKRTLDYASASNTGVFW
jgi:hypothetical protein